MSEFIQIPATKQSIAQRKPVWGVGLNDADYHVVRITSGGRHGCPFYSKWTGMLQRCYSKPYRQLHPSYTNCVVADEWLIFTNFREWMVKQDWKGNHLDKDILSPVDKLYSKKTCVFIPQEINKLLTNHAAGRGKYPQGVTRRNSDGRFLARISAYGKEVRIGVFPTPEEAESAYKSAKSAHIIEVAQSQPARVKAGLITIAENMMRMNAG